MEIHERMDKITALIQTRSKFTNLLDGKVLPTATVTGIISYYESLIADEKPVTHKPTSGIIANFMEDEFNEMLDEDDY